MGVTGSDLGAWGVAPEITSAAATSAGTTRLETGAAPVLNASVAAILPAPGTGTAVGAVAGTGGGSAVATATGIPAPSVATSITTSPTAAARCSAPTSSTATARFSLVDA
jgi:hypothetical protein